MAFLDMVKKVLEPLEAISARRPDGDLVRKIHPYRKMLPYVMPGRNEAVVYYEDLVKAEALLDYTKRASAAFGFEVDITHCLVAAGAAGLYAVPRMNQFVAGRRLYKRKDVCITFSAKRTQGDKKAKLAAVKLFFEKGESFQSICSRINKRINVERSGKKTYSDTELDIMTTLPRPLLSGAMKVVEWADYHNLVPSDFIKNDGFYTSMFIANLGSLGMNAGYHHLYEYGNCPLFMMTGAIEERPMVVDGELTAQKVLPIHWTYDERIDDGLTSFDGIRHVRHCLERPDEMFGGLPPVDNAE